MKIKGTEFVLSMTTGASVDTMHLKAHGLTVSFTSWKDFSQGGRGYLALYEDGQVVADIQGENANKVYEALTDWGMR